MDFPDKKYSVIYADPPWTYRDKCHAGERGAGYKYPLMTFSALAKMPIDSLAADDAILFLWATWPLLSEAIDLMPRWGFSYKTIGFIWVKTNPKSGTPFIGMGNWTRSNSEPCLLGVRGKPKREGAAVSSVVLSPRREHSRKPDEVRDKIVELCGDVPRLEMFARTQVEGWDVWGNEVNKYE